MIRMLLGVTSFFLVLGCARIESGVLSTPQPKTTGSPEVQPAQRDHEQQPLAPSCSAEPEALKQRATPAWIAKTARVLRHKAGIGVGDDMRALSQMTRGEVLDHFMSDPRFSETTLQFARYFLGSMTDRVYDTYSIREGAQTRFVKTMATDVLLTPQAIDFARDIEAGKNSLAFLRFDAPIYLSWIGRPFLPSDADQYPSDEAKRKHLRKMVQEQHEKLIPLAATVSSPETLKTFCQQYNNNPANFIQTAIFYGMPFQILYHLVVTQRVIDCENLKEKGPELVALLKKDYEFQVQIYDRLDMIVSKQNNFKSFKDVSTFLTSEETFKKGGWTYLLHAQPERFSNSSTNFNRKRAAYVLSRYFCDDLTPLNIVKPDAHAGNKHASDPSCLACHYKLDPMAGFFRTRGVIGIDFAQFNSPDIIFSDGARASLDGYISNWRSSSPDRQWDVGYIRSARKDALNAYGESMEDLESIIADSPEVKSCVVKRMAEFFVAENQNFDSGYMDALSREFACEAEQPTGQAYRKTVKALLVSQAFAQQNPDPRQCYDYLPGESPAGKPPCEVSFILQKNCIQCHSPQNLMGGLDLSRWVKDNSGQMTFPHTDEGGVAKTKQQTFKSIIERLNTNDTSLQMPLNKEMPTLQREKLYKWTFSEAGGQ